MYAVCCILYIINPKTLNNSRFMAITTIVFATLFDNNISFSFTINYLTSPLFFFFDFRWVVIDTIMFHGIHYYTYPPFEVTLSASNRIKHAYKVLRRFFTRSINCLKVKVLKLNPVRLLFNLMHHNI